MIVSVELTVLTVTLYATPKLNDDPRSGPPPQAVGDQGSKDDESGDAD